MMHSSPMPLGIALDMCKRLQQELSRHLTPEQRRDFERMERLIGEAQRQATSASRRDGRPAAHAPRTRGARGLWS